MNEKIIENKNIFAYDSLEEVRKKLLDLTAKNSLLNYKHQKSSVRLIDELPDQIFDELNKGSSMTFLPVPEPTESDLITAGFIKTDPISGNYLKEDIPTAEQWAKYLGFDTSYDLPKSNITKGPHHKDTNLQCLYYPPELEARLRSIRNRANSALDEAGVNILFLSIGFLEWYESNDSEIKRIAPLFNIPVRLERSNKPSKDGVFRYTIKLIDEGLLTNITLKHKLFDSFGLSLPEIKEEIKPEDYFNEIERTVLRQHPRWKLRRQMSVSLLNFSKQVIYKDLDPENWPENASLEQHPVIAHLFGGNSLEITDHGNGVENYPIDTYDNIHDDFPIIYDADNSQHSALIDAVKGNNLVIIGPPGTGKSQTITNIIAALISNGKKVLFVAEKMAALNVVKNRLDKAKLGEFCLELHSHKSNKQKILSDLVQRISKHKNYQKPSDINVEIQLFEEYKNKLRNYALKINSEWKSTGLSLHDIFSRATRYREELKIDPESLEIVDLNGEYLTQQRQKELVDRIDMLQDIYQQVAEQAMDGAIENHYWYGITNFYLAGFQIDKLKGYLQHWNNALHDLDNYWTNQNEKLELAISEDSSLDEIKRFNSSLLKLPDSVEFIPFNQIPALVKERTSFEKWIQVYESFHNDQAHILKVIKSNTVLEPATIVMLLSMGKVVNKLGLEANTTMREFHKYGLTVRSAYDKTKFVKNEFEKIIPNLPNELQAIFTTTITGFNEFKTFVELMKSLPVELWKHRDDIYDNPDLDPVLDKMTSSLKKLTPLHKQLIEVFSLHRLPSAEQLKQCQNIYHEGGTFKWFSSEWKMARKYIRRLSAQPKVRLKQLVDLMPELINYAEGIAEMERLNEEGNVLSEHYRGVETPVERLVSLRQWYKKVRAEYGMGFGERSKIGNLLISLDRNLAMAILDENNKELNEYITNINNNVAHLKTVFQNYKPLGNQDAELKSLLACLLNQISNFFKLIKPVLNGSGHSINEISRITTKLQEHQQQVKAWQENKITDLIHQSGLTISAAPDSSNIRNISIIKTLLNIVQVVSDEPLLLNSLMNSPSVSRYGALCRMPKELNKLINDVDVAKNEFINIGKVNVDEWDEITRGKLNVSLYRNKLALEHPEWLQTWIDYIRIRSKLAKGGLDKIVSELENRQIEAQDLVKVLKLVIHHQLAKEILNEDRSLAMFSGMEQMAVRKKYQEYDRKLLELQRALVAYKTDQVTPPVGISSGRVKNFTELGLIRHNAGLTRPRIAIRSLMKGARRAIQDLKPCFMMSPMSVAQFLEPGKFEFDVVVMDEASQIRPQEALGSIARGKNLIVVGDPKQLPPTSFFERSFSGDDDEDNVALQLTESILETVEPIFMNRLLEWHYRSQHESLIAFSNQKFYDSRLVIFPSPFNKSNQHGITYRRVHKGRNTDNRNVEEAKSVVSEAGDQLLKYPKDSIGIVAMNIYQREEIERQLDQYIKDNPEVQEAYSRNQNSDEPLFIKNLENVQGDERDVIIMSMTYAPDTTGATYMHQRFGPINSEVGWRRLNVLFTRSKKRMFVHSSMDSGFIRISEKSSRGVLALKNWLEYCETGVLTQAIHTGREPDSDFEVAVMKALSQHGYECEPQLGVAGYYLDIAVRDPGMPGRFLLGIECDGATYHSAKSTRDRDRLRQEILEGLGWKIRRIWSTDWFKHPEAQLQPILNELNELRTTVGDDYQKEIQPINEIDKKSFESTVQKTELSEKPEIVNDEPLDLRSRLVKFDTDIIRKEFLDTSDSKRLLRPAMLEALLNYLPCSKAEFLEVIPSYLRNGTQGTEGKYLEEVLEMIAEYS